VQATPARQHGSAYAQVVVPWGRTDAEVTIDEILRRARSELDRVTPPAQAWAMGAGAVLADIRPEFQRRADGEIPGAVVIERVHLEWRCDPTSPARVPEAVDHDVRWIVCCDEGYSSSLVSLLACITDTRTVSGVMAAARAAGSTRPWPSTGR